MPERQGKSTWERVVELTIAIGERILAPIERFIGKRSLVGDATFFPLERFPWVEHIEQNWTVIREEAERLLEEMPEGTGRLVIDLTHTREVDSAGLGALMLIQRVAAERRQAVVLRNPSEEMRFLLTITKLYDLFIVDTSYD